MPKILKRCTVCILPETYAGIRFDENGVRNIHPEPGQRSLPSEKTLKNQRGITARPRRDTGRHDAVIGLSGGRDRSRVACYFNKEYDLGIVGIHVGNGYRSE